MRACYLSVPGRRPSPDQRLSGQAAAPDSAGREARRRSVSGIRPAAGTTLALAGPWPLLSAGFLAVSLELLLRHVHIRVQPRRVRFQLGAVRLMVVRLAVLAGHPGLLVR